MTDIHNGQAKTDVRPIEVDDGRFRAIIERVSPEIDCGRFPVKRVVGERVRVEVDVFTDGHEAVSAVLRYRHVEDRDWVELSLNQGINDRWFAEFTVDRMGRYQYTVEAWLDHFRGWHRDFLKRIAAGQDVSVDLRIGGALISEAAQRADGDHAERLRGWSEELTGAADMDVRSERALDEELVQLALRYPDRSFASRYPRELEIVVDRVKARYSTWYELFPRSTGENGKHGTFQDVEAQLTDIAQMGFDVLYLPPIHPIGTTHRKGKNNSTVAGPDDPGSPWGIGSEQGGHTAIHPELGTIEDFRRLLASARDYGLEVALDIAFQASPDHPYVKEHPTWFRQRPDGTVQYAENPPKKYQDIYPFEFDTEDWPGLWDELKNVFLYWIDQGVRIFRVDNPHTKPFAFWEWVIAEITRDYPETIFLSEAFTRPKVMYRLAKLGFTQSYNYFPWRNTQWELKTYFTELTQTEVQEYFRPNLWPNTPDILTEYLQVGGRPAFSARLILAATLGASYGIYGPAFELLESEPLEWGREEYLNSEKYEIRDWDLTRTDNLRDLIIRVNQIRRDNPALQTNATLRFLNVDNEQLVAYTKTSEDGDNIIVTVVSVDPYHTHSGWIELPLEELGLSPEQGFQAHDLLTGARYLWQGAYNYVEINPHAIPAHVLRIRRQVSTERDFDYFM